VHEKSRFFNRYLHGETGRRWERGGAIGVGCDVNRRAVGQGMPGGSGGEQAVGCWARPRPHAPRPTRARSCAAANQAYHFQAKGEKHFGLARVLGLLVNLQGLEADDEGL
jgi:hypothetical protein